MCVCVCKIMFRGMLQTEGSRLTEMVNQEGYSRL